jgi:hypothetical protein
MITSAVTNRTTSAFDPTAREEREREEIEKKVTQRMSSCSKKGKRGKSTIHRVYSTRPSLDERMK